MAPTVLLRHELPDGTWHFDWLIARSDKPGGPDDRVLVAFRVRERPWEGERFQARRLEDHRAAYLTYEGPVSGGRGRVERVAEGEAWIEEERAEEMVVRMEWGAGERVVRGRREEGERWVFAPEG